MDLLGCILIHDSSEGRTSGIIVETEAYRPEDPACHAYKGPTMRNRNIFGGPGIAYVYLSYGIHHLINVVCEGEGIGSAVLIRALQPVEGEEAMIERRGRNFDLCNGPGKLTQALGITLDADGHDLTNGKVNITWNESPSGEIVSTTRIGISRGVELPWRYLILDDPNVSVPPKHLHGRDLQRSV
ncbi:DNA-3-methyladenine glycosylase [soil metagenome]